MMEKESLKKKGPPSLGIREIRIKSPRIISNTSDFSESWRFGAFSKDT